MSKDLKLPKLYKTLLLLAIVIGPIYWLVLTSDGQRRTDLALMYLFGKQEFNAALDRFQGNMTESSIRELFPKLELQCNAAPNPFGDRLCAAEIGSFNAVPALSVTFFFSADELRAAKVRYQRAYHGLVRGWIERRLAQDSATPAVASAPKIVQGVASWPTRDGTLVLKDGPLGDADEPALFWLSAAAAAGLGSAGDGG